MRDFSIARGLIGITAIILLCVSSQYIASFIFGFGLYLYAFFLLTIFAVVAFGARQAKKSPLVTASLNLCKFGMFLTGFLIIVSCLFIITAFIFLVALSSIPSSWGEFLRTSIPLILLGIIPLSLGTLFFCRARHSYNDLKINPELITPVIKPGKRLAFLFPCIYFVAGLLLILTFKSAPRFFKITIFFLLGLTILRIVLLFIFGVRFVGPKGSCNSKSKAGDI